MSNIKIVLDSSADVTLLADADFAYAPLKINTVERKFVDDNELAVADMVEYLYTYKGKSSTSCPNTEDWITALGDAEAFAASMPSEAECLWVLRPGRRWALYIGEAAALLVRLIIKEGDSFGNGISYGSRSRRRDCHRCADRLYIQGYIA